MLPPPITTPKMDDDTNNTKRLATQQQKQQHYQSVLYSNTSSTNTTTTADISTATNSFPTVPLNAGSIKNFFNKTLANVAKSNLSEYTAQYSSAFSNLAPATSSSASTQAIAAGVYDGLIGDKTAGVAAGVSGGSYAAAADIAVNTLTNSSHHLETTTTAQTVATFIAGNKNRATTIIVYPTVSPESIVIPIVSCIFGFPILAFIIICCLRHRAKLARERDRRRNYDMQDHAVSLITDRRELSVYVLNEA